MKTRELTIIALLSSLLSVSAYIAIPIPSFTVTFTLQTLVIMVIGLSMPRKIAVTSVLIYLFIGAIGLPVFSKGQAGLMVLLGPTGGYLFGFLVATWFMSLLKTTTWMTRFLSAIVFGVILVYGFGVLGLMWVLQISFFDAFMVGAVPFILLDLIKAVISATISTKYQSFFRKLGH